MSGRLAGKVGVITGAARGQGEAHVRRFVAEGAKVVATDVLKDEGEALAAELGESVVFVTHDVADEAQWAAVVERAEAAFGGIDVLVNNAGIMPLSFVKNLHVDEWLRMVDVNVNGVLHGIAAVLPTMLEQGSGHIVNVSSVAGRRVFPGGAVYCGTKHAVTAISEGLRQELTPKHGIRVTCIEPGSVATELPETITDEELRKASEGRWDFKVLESEDVAAAIRYALEAPEHVDVSEVLLMPSGQRV